MESSWHASGEVSMTLYKYSSPAGCILLGSTGNELCLCKWEAAYEQSAQQNTGKTVYGHDKIICETIKQLDEYFNVERTVFNLSLSINGTDFQQRVWQELARIPYGTTITYGELARRIGNAKASRAVAMACHNNPISIIIPCHRVIGCNGKLTGYAGGLDKKAILLDIENNLFINYFKTT